MIIGPVANSVCIIAGSLLGSLCGPVISADLRQKFITVFSCITLGIGVTMLGKGDSLPPVVLSILLGTCVGEAVLLGSGVGLAGHMETICFNVSYLGALVFRRKHKKSDSIPETVFRDQFAVVTVLFCVSGLGVLGSIREGLTGEYALLLIKGILDLFTAMLVAAGIGSVIGILALPQFCLQAILLLGAGLLIPYITPTMFADFSACGGIIMLGAGLRQMGLAQPPLVSMLPALFFVMPLSALLKKIL